MLTLGDQNVKCAFPTLLMALASVEIVEAIRWKSCRSNDWVVRLTWGNDVAYLFISGSVGDYGVFESKTIPGDFPIP